MTDQTPAETAQEQTYKLDDTTIAGLMQLLTLAIVTGSNLMDHLRLMELRTNDEGRLVMTDEFIEHSEEFAKELAERVDTDDSDDGSFGFFDG